MKAVIQKVAEATVTIENKIQASIKVGMLILLGITNNDTSEDIDWLSSKIANIRLFNDVDTMMNLNVNDVNGQIIIVSQFTLFASTKKGNRPSYIYAAKPDVAIPMYNQFIDVLQTKINTKVETGIFAANMKVLIVNDGPVTIIIDTKNKE